MPWPPPLTPRLLSGMAGLFVAALMGGFNNRLGALGLADIRGIHGFAYDDASWLTSFYSAGELVIMPFVIWLITIFSFRRMAIFWLMAVICLAAPQPLIQNLPLLIGLRFLQGVACGALIFMLMISIFMFLPPRIRMYGFGFYAMVATVTPYTGIWMTALWTDVLHDWRWLYWQSIPLALLALGLVIRGLPHSAGRPERLKTTNWRGMVCIIPGSIMLAISFDQGMRLDWFNSSFVTWGIVCGSALMIIYGISEWFHQDPFLQLRIFISHRNIFIGLMILLCVLTMALAASLLPMSYLSRIWDYRPMQSASVGLIVALPQIVLGPLIAFLLYRRFIDSRALYILSMLLIAGACYWGAHVDEQWIAEQFYPAQALLAVGLPLAVITTIFVTSSRVTPQEGPSMGGAINTLRCLGILLGNAIVSQFCHTRQMWHYEALREHSSSLNPALHAMSEAQTAQTVNNQAFTSSIADAYCLLGTMALIIAVIILCLQYTAPYRAKAPVGQKRETHA